MWKKCPSNENVLQCGLVAGGYITGETSGRAECALARGPSNHQGRWGEGGDLGVKSKGGGHSLQGFVHGFLGRGKKTRRWPAGNAPCICGIFFVGEPEGRAECALVGGPSNHQGVAVSAPPAKLI